MEILWLAPTKRGKRHAFPQSGNEKSLTSLCGKAVVDTEDMDQYEDDNRVGRCQLCVDRLEAMAFDDDEHVKATVAAPTPKASTLTIPEDIDPTTMPNAYFKAMIQNR